MERDQIESKWESDSTHLGNYIMFSLIIIIIMIAKRNILFGIFFAFKLCRSQMSTCVLLSPSISALNLWMATRSSPNHASFPLQIWLSFHVMYSFSLYSSIQIFWRVVLSASVFIYLSVQMNQQGRQDRQPTSAEMHVFFDIASTE